MTGDLTIKQFNDFVTNAEARGVQHDQVQTDANGALVRVSNSTGSKIKRFFSFLSSVGSEQVAKNREIRTKLLAAIRNDNNGGIPDELADTLKECGFDLSRKNEQSYKSLSSRAIRVILGKYSEIKSKAQVLASNAKSNALTGDTVTGTIKTATAKSIVDKLMALPKSEYMTNDQRQKLTSLIDCMTRAGVSPNKIVRMTYLFTVAMNKIADGVAKNYKLPEEPKVPDEPSADDKPEGYPDKPSDPRGGFFFKFSTKEKQFAAIESYKKELAEYEKDVEEFVAKSENQDVHAYFQAMKAHVDGEKAHGEWMTACKSITDGCVNTAKQLIEDVFKGIEPYFAMLQQEADAPLPNGQIAISPHDVAERNMFADAIIGAVRDTCEGRENTKGLFDKIAGTGLKDLDVRLNACVAKENPPAANVQTKFSSTKPLSFVKIGFGQVAEMIKKTLSSKIGEIATIGDLSLTPVESNSGMFNLSLKNVNIEKVPGGLRKLFGDSRFIPDLNVQIGLAVDSRTGALEVTLGKFASEKDENLAKILNNSLEMVLKMQSEKLGPNVFIDDKIASSVYSLGSIGELSVKDVAPVRIGFPKGGNVDDGLLELTIDPTRVDLIKTLGLEKNVKFNGDMKFGAVRVVGNDLVLQVGGTNDEIDSVLVKAQNPGEKDRIDTNKLPGEFCANIDMRGLSETVGFLMRENGVTFDSMNVTTNPQDGTVSVDIRNFDAKNVSKVKNMKELKGKALRTFGNGSFRLNFKPSVVSGDIQLKFANAESLGGPSNWLKKTLVNLYMRSIAEGSIPINPDINIVDDDDPNAPLTLKINTVGVRDLSNFGGKGLAEVSALKVTPNGLSLGMNVAMEKARPGRVVESLA